MTVRYCALCNRRTPVAIDFADAAVEVVRCAVCGAVHYLRKPKVDDREEGRRRDL